MDEIACGKPRFERAQSRNPNKDLTMVGLVVMVGAALSWLSARYPAELPVWGPWEFSWIEYLGCALALCWYVRGILSMAPEARPAVWRQIFYYLGVASIYAVTQTKLTYVAQHLFMATQIQQFILHDIAPFLIALSWPGTVMQMGMPPSLRRGSQARPILAGLRVVQQPVIAAVLFILLLVGQVLPAIVFRMMLDWRVFDAMNILMVVDGVLFWCLVLDPRPKPPATIAFFTRIVLAFVVMLPVMPIGGYIAFTSHPLYTFYDLCGRLDWFSPSNDQVLGGLMLLIPSGLMNSVAILLLLNAMRLAEESRERVSGKTVVDVGQHRIDPAAWTGR